MGTRACEAMMGRLSPVFYFFGALTIEQNEKIVHFSVEETCLRIERPGWEMLAFIEPCVVEMHRTGKSAVERKQIIRVFVDLSVAQ